MWYYRHWKDFSEHSLEGVKSKDKMPESAIMDAEWNDWMRDDPRNPQSQEKKDERAYEK